MSSARRKRRGSMRTCVLQLNFPLVGLSLYYSRSFSLFPLAGRRSGSRLTLLAAEHAGCEVSKQRIAFVGGEDGQQDHAR